MTDEESRQLDAIRALLKVAMSNFPEQFKVTLTVIGPNTGSIRVDPYILDSLLRQK